MEGSSSHEQQLKALTEKEVQKLLPHISYLKSNDITKNIKRANRTGRKCSLLGLLHVLLYRLLPLACLVFYMFQRFSALYEGQTCFVTQYSVPEFAMRIGDCDVCKNVNESIIIDEISPIDFMAKHAFNTVPLLMRGAASDWPAVKLFTFDYFKSLYNNNPESLAKDTSEGQFFAYSSGISDIGELMEILNEGRTQHSKWYIGWSTDDPVVGKEMRQHIREPYFLPPDSSEKGLAWIFMGSPGPGASLHVDWVGRVSWQAQLSGVKTWTLVPPPECEHVCRSLNVTVSTGDIIVVDTNFWFHSTYVHPGKVSMTYGTEFE